MDRAFDEVQREHETGVDLGGLLQVVAENLYSTPMVSVRELVQNAHDSVTRRRFEDPDAVASDFEIVVTADESARTLMVADTGAGLTEDEIHQFLATIGTGYTRQLRGDIEGGDGSDLIGLFGIGFLSAFVVSERVEVTTTSFKSPGETHKYVSNDGQRYSVERVESQPIGTTVGLSLKERHSVLSSPESIESTLQRYARLLTCPVRVNRNPPINATAPPWRDERKLGPEEANLANLEFAAQFERSFMPLCAKVFRGSGVPKKDELGMATSLGAGVADVQGLFWVQDGSTYGSSDNRNLSVFVRRMLLDDDARDLLPRWAGFVGGVIESSTMTPTASREDLQRDEVYDAVAHEISEQLIAWLAELPRTEPDTWRRILRRHNSALIGAALSDERLFSILDHHLRVPTTTGDLTVRELFERTGNARLHVSLSAGAGFEDMLLRAQKIPVARGEFFGVLALLRRFSETNHIELIELGSDSANQVLFTEVDLDPLDRSWLMEHLVGLDERLVPAVFEPATVPLVSVPDREAELKSLIEDDDADNRISASVLKLARMHTHKTEERAPTQLFVNLNNPAIASVLEHRRTSGNTIAAITLLRSIKTLLTAGDSAGSTGKKQSEVADALDEVSRIVSDMVTPPQ